VNAADTVLVLMIKTVGGTNRAGGAPTFAGQTMLQADSTQKAAASPECSAELWYLLSPPAGAGTASIPNTGAAQIFYTIATGRSSTGQSALDGANGSNNTSTNPSPGAVTTTVAGDIGFAIVASGAQTWAPSAQAGTNIANTDDGAHGGGEQYFLDASTGSRTLGWTFATSDDWGAVAAFFKEVAPTPVINDTATGSEGQSFSASSATADTGTGSETQASAGSAVSADTASGSESQSFANSAPIADTASASEGRSFAAGVTNADAGAGGEAVAYAAAAAIAETVSAGDAETMSGLAALADSAAADETNSTDETSSTVEVTVDDTATASETRALSAASTAADTAAADDEFLGFVDFVLVDTAAALDNATWLAQATPPTPPLGISVNSGRTKIDTATGLTTINVNSGRTFINVNIGDPPS
jgi:hypothetical protein